MKIRFKDGTEETLDAETAFEFCGVDSHSFDGSSILHIANRMYGRGLLGNRKFEFVDPLVACFNPLWGEGGYYYVQPREILEPLQFPDYLPHGVKLPEVWRAENATEENIAASMAGMAFGLYRGQKELLTFMLTGCDTYFILVSINAKHFVADDYFKKLGRIHLADFMADAQSIIVTLCPESRYRRKGGTSCEIAVGDLPSAWYQEMVHLELLKFDEAYRAEHTRQEVSRAKELALQKFGLLSASEALSVIQQGGQLRIGSFTKEFQLGKAVDTFFVVTADGEFELNLSSKCAIPARVAGVITESDALQWIEQSYRYTHGLIDQAALKPLWPGRTNAFVHSDSALAVPALKIRTGTLIDWEQKETLSDVNGCELYKWKGNSLLGPHWTLQLEYDGRFSGWRIHMSRHSATDVHGIGDFLLSEQGHDYCGMLAGETLSDALMEAQKMALTEEVHQILKRGVSVSDLSTDLLHLWLSHLEKSNTYKAHRINNDGPFSNLSGAVATEIERRSRTIESQGSNWWGEGDIDNLKEKVKKSYRGA
jgi:hypothetical protein